MPERFLLQILRSLVTHGILSSTSAASTEALPGAHPVEEVSLMEVIEAIDGPMSGEPSSAKGMPKETHRRTCRRAQRG